MSIARERGGGEDVHLNAVVPLVVQLVQGVTDGAEQFEPLVVVAIIAILASLLFSITPALQTSRTDLNEALKESARGNTGRRGFQRALVVTEVALALVLTACRADASLSRLSLHPGAEGSSSPRRAYSSVDLSGRALPAAI